MILVSEDLLSESVAQRLLSEIRPDLHVSVSIGGRGKGYLQARARELNRTARHVPVFMLSDLDRPDPCPPTVVTNWLHGPPEARMFFRIAVMEVESWLLADRVRCSAFLGVNAGRIPADTDGIGNPKEFLVGLARRSRLRAVREDMVPAHGAIVAIGPGYNARLTSFVSEQWRPNVAAENSASLQRTVHRLQAF